jgi:hypothetical protein
MGVFKINITNDSANTKVTTGASPFTSAIVTKEVSNGINGTILYLTFYIHPNSDYYFDNFTDLTYTIGGTGYTAASNGSVYSSGNTSLSVSMVNGSIRVDGIHQIEPGVTLNLTLSGGAISLSSNPPSDGDSIGAGSDSAISSNPVSGIGNTYNFEQTRSIQIKHQSHFNILNKNDDWAVSFGATIPPSQSIAGRREFSLVQKRNTLSTIGDDGLETTKADGSGQYPFDISFYSENHPTSPGHIFVKASDGNITMNFSSSTAYADGTHHKYVLNKKDDLIYLYVDGIVDTSASYSFKTNVNNDRDILIGSRNVENTEANFSGSISQFRISKTALTDDNIISLADTSPSGSALQRKEVGYVFYKQGMIITSDPRYRYQNIFLGNNNGDYTNRDYELKYRSTKTIEEVSVLCEINRNEYNVSSNPSLRIGGTADDNRLINMVTGSDFRPYITQLGLYNDTGDLLAIAKLGSPLKKRKDVDVTINVKFDID